MAWMYETELYNVHSPWITRNVFHLCSATWATVSNLSWSMTARPMTFSLDHLQLSHKTIYDTCSSVTWRLESTGASPTAAPNPATFIHGYAQLFKFWSTFCWRIPTSRQERLSDQQSIPSCLIGLLVDTDQLPRPLLDGLKLPHNQIISSMMHSDQSGIGPPCNTCTSGRSVTLSQKK